MNMAFKRGTCVGIQEKWEVQCMYDPHFLAVTYILVLFYWCRCCRLLYFYASPASPATTTAASAAAAAGAATAAALAHAAAAAVPGGPELHFYPHRQAPGQGQGGGEGGVMGLRQHSLLGRDVIRAVRVTAATCGGGVRWRCVAEACGSYP